MAYVHQVFISYKREKNWSAWTQKPFVELLKSYLQRDLGYAPSVFVDTTMEGDIGFDLADRLAEALAQSQVVVPLLSRDYFGSEWCISELDLMMGRRNEAMGRPPLVLPIVVHDCEHLPEPIDNLIRRDFSRYSVVGINEQSRLFEELSLAVKALTPSIKEAIATAPDFDAAWVNQYTERFREVAKAVRDGTVHEPKNFLVTRPTPPLTPPRLAMGAGR